MKAFNILLLGARCPEFGIVHNITGSGVWTIMTSQVMFLGVWPS